MSKVHIFRYSLQISRDKFFSPRAGSLFLVVLFCFYTRFSPLREFTEMVGYDVTPWIFPCLLSNLSFQLTIAFCGAYFFSEVPFMQYKEMYQMIRCGRVRWATAHILSILELSTALSASLMILSVLFLVPRISFSLQWGEVIHTLAQTNASQLLPFAVPYNLLASYTPVQAMMIAFLLMIGIFFFLGLFMFAISLFLSRIYAVAAVTFLAAWSVIIYNMPYYYQRTYSYFAPLSWLNIAEVNKRVTGLYILPDYLYISIALMVLPVILSYIIVARIKNMDCYWYNED